MAGEMTLTYFKLRGRAEPSRLLFKLAGKSFVDNRVEGEEWQKFKPKTPKGLLPVLEVDGKMMCESNAIARFLAREFNLYGSTNYESAVCDMVSDSISTLYESAGDYKFYAKTEEGKASALKKSESGLVELEKLVAPLKKGTFMLGESASLADVLIYAMVEFFEAALSNVKLDSCVKIQEIAKSFAALPSIAEWIKTRPESSM